MAVTRLKRKDRRNKAVAKNKLAKIQHLNSKPVIKNVDVEEIASGFGTTDKKEKPAAKKAEPVKEEKVVEEVQEAVVEEPKAEETTVEVVEEPKAEEVVEEPNEEIAEPKAEAEKPAKKEKVAKKEKKED